jgi:hypothetical protein
LTRLEIYREYTMTPMNFPDIPIVATVRVGCTLLDPRLYRCNWEASKQHRCTTRRAQVNQRCSSTNTLAMPASTTCNATTKTCPLSGS